MNIKAAMDNHRIEYLSTRIRASYRAITKRMAPNDEDDCVQECILRYWQNGKGQTIEQAVIDYLRREKGDKRTASFEERKSLNSAAEFKENEYYETPQDATTLDLNLLHGRNRLIIEKYIQGYTEIEIGQMVRVSESRVSQIIKDSISIYQVMSLVPKNLRGWVIQNAFKSGNTSFRQTKKGP